MSEVPEILREAYVRDIIDLETFERFVSFFVNDEPCALPMEVIALNRQWGSDAPGQIFYYNPVNGTPHM